jgi:hypothetical protein
MFGNAHPKGVAGAPDPACRSVKGTVRSGDGVGPAAFDAGRWLERNPLDVKPACGQECVQSILRYSSDIALVATGGSCGCAASALGLGE